MSIGRRWKGLVGTTGLAAVLALAFGGGDGHAQSLPTTQPYLWSTPVNLDLINSEHSEDLPHISRDGNSLYFISDRPRNGSTTDFDIYVSHRQGGVWGLPKRLGRNINTSFNERGPCLSPDGHYLFFSSDRQVPGAFGSQDLYVSYREDTSNDFGWEVPYNLGDAVNTANPDYGAALIGNLDGTLSSLLFGRRVDGHNHIYMSGYFYGYLQQAAPVTELNHSDSNDWRPTVRADGLQLFFHSDRPESMGYDIWVSTRPDLSSLWSPPSRVGPPINTDSDEQFPAVSADGSMLIFSSNRPGSIGSDTSDLWVSTRRPIIHYWP